MDAEALTRQISSLDGVRVAENQGDQFFLYDPDGDLPPERQMPFVTIVVGDHYEKDSDLDRPGVYRLNIGLTKTTYTGLFGTLVRPDYTALDVLMPHPVYAGQHWVCVLNPSDETIRQVEPLIRDAYDFAVRKYTNWRS